MLAELLGPPYGSNEGADAVPSWHMRLALAPTVAGDIEAALSGRGASLCLLIDQFEELFRYAKEKSREEAELLTRLLCSLASESNPAPHLFVILTMRSDYLGECARFDGFAETVNACQYLLPRLDDFGILRAIHEPATLYGGTIEPAVGDRLLFAARQEEDALPVLQHALMRAWAHARRRNRSREGWTVTIADLQAVEGKEGALSQHADEVLAKIQAANPMHLKPAEWLFRRLTELDAEGRGIRRPCNIAELVGVAGGDRSGVIAVIEAFRSGGCNFLVTNPSGPLTDTTEVDVSHEALIRGWRRLSDPRRDPVRHEPAGWVLREFEDGQRWRALAVQARLFRHDKSATLSPATTEAYESWWPEHTPAWAARYAREKHSAAEEYRDIEELWEASKKGLEFERTRLELEAKAATRLRFQRRLIAAVLVILLVFSGLLIFALKARDAALEARAAALKSRDEALEWQDNMIKVISLVGSSIWGIWVVDGSYVSLEPNGNTRRFTFVQPRSDLLAQCKPASGSSDRPPGCVGLGRTLFFGEKRRESYVGKLFAFPGGRCQPREYDAAGPISDNDETVTLTGKEPQLDPDSCTLRSEQERTLVFIFKYAAKRRTD